MLKGERFLAASVDGASKLHSVVGVNCEGFPGAADRDVELLPIDQFRRQARVDVHNHAINGCALRGVRRGSVSVVDVAQAVGRGAHFLAVVKAHHGPMRIDGFDRGEIAIGNAECPVGCAELYPVSLCEDSLFFLKDFDAEEADRIVADGPPGGSDAEDVLIGIDRLDSGVTILGDGELLAPTSEANHVAHFVVVRNGALRAREAAIHKDRVLLTLRFDMAASNQFSTNGPVKFASFLIGRADNQNALARLMGGGVLACDLVPALADVGDFADVAAALKDRE